jgi:hypothetical protein
MLTVIGLCFEFLSGLIVIRKLFYEYMKRIEEKGKTVQTKIKQDRREGILVLSLLIVGMTLQALAVFY